MKSFLRENPTIAFGLGLPLLLVVAFLLISGIPALLVAPPQYDVLYASNLYGYGPGLQISVVNKKVQVVYQGNSVNYQQVRLWRFSPKTGAVKEITFALPQGLSPPSTVQQILPPGTPETQVKVTPIEIPELANLTVDPSSIAPDGYEFRAGGNGYSGDIFTEFFGAARYRNEAALTKSGRSIRLPHADGGDYSYFPARFIGWVIAP
jgi:hypothetical protein